MKHTVNLILETDSIDWARTVQANLSRQRNCEVTLSEAVDYILQIHWKKTMKRALDQRHAERFGPALKNTRLIRARA